MIIIELLLNGLVEGCLLALICIGYTLAYGVARILNFAHADVMIAGGGYLVLLLIAGDSFSTSICIGTTGLFAGAATIAIWPRRKLNGIIIWRKTLVSITLGLSVFFVTFLFAGKLSLLTATFLAAPLTGLLAAAIYRLGYEPLIHRNAPRMSILLSALAFSIALQSLLLMLWGSTTRAFLPDLLPSWLVVTHGEQGLAFGQSVIEHGLIPITNSISLPTYDALIILIFTVTVLTYEFFFRKTKICCGIIAAADSKIAARACGIPVDKMFTYAFLIGGALASVGGTLFVLRNKSMNPTAGFSVGIIAFVACVLGGIGNIRGSVLGAFMVSMILSLAPAIPLDDWANSHLTESLNEWLPSLNLGDWSYGVIYIIMIITVMFKPRGLFSE